MAGFLGAGGAANRSLGDFRLKPRLHRSRTGSSNPFPSSGESANFRFLVEQRITHRDVAMHAAATAKSLLTFANRISYVPFNAGTVVRLPPAINVLAERILAEEQVVRLIALEQNARNHALLRLLYLAALRVSEACALRWAACKARRGAGQITVVGKRGKVRSILLPAPMWRELIALRGDAGSEDPVFKSRQGGPLDPMSVQRIVKAAAIRARLPKAVSPHWLRHAHCSHALDRGANPALVRDTAGHADLRVTSVYSHAQPNESSSRFLIG